ncbi:hypothetical protein OIV83_000172 [Microbotryomycetes sp. JL201]|nr:hypothetical protein OIV83_000172 [Microbotryomycetes sp. JL201]
MRHRQTPSQEWRQRARATPPDQQQYSVAPPRPHFMGEAPRMLRSATDPQGARPRPQHAPAPPILSPNAHSTFDIDSYYRQGNASDQWDDDKTSITSHTALTFQNDSEKSHYPPSSSPLAVNQVPRLDYFGHAPQQQARQPYSPGGISSPQSPFAPRPAPTAYLQGPPPPSPYQQTVFYRERERLLARREQKRVQLTDGHLVLDLDVPKSLKQHISYRGDDLREESGKLRYFNSSCRPYTAVTDDPDDFTRQGYRLRQVRKGRQTELFICMTMYNEDEHLFVKTMTAVIKNVQHLQNRKRSKTWGEHSWKKVVVCIVSDGRAKINPRTLRVLGLYGAYQDGIAKDTVDGKDVKAHVFEYTSQVVVGDDGQVLGGVAPIQILFCLKEQNQKKLNSHRWAMNAFCSQLRPNVCVLLDVGTKPSGTSIYSLWKEFDRHSNVGGACGEIAVDTGRGCSNLLWPIVAAQNFEYKMSNILDKPLESAFGLISVLPGAFSAYRYSALVGKPLEAYFLGERIHDGGYIASLADSNMYLAEDRILCWEIVCKAKESWILKYVKSARATTDAPDTIAEFIQQRRRWLNGSNFASLHALTHFFKLFSSGHNVFRVTFLSILFIYQTIQFIFAMIGLSSFYLAFFFICSAATSDKEHDPFGGQGAKVISIANSVYIATLGITVVCALGNSPRASRWWYCAVMVCFAALFGIALYCTAWTIYLAVPHTLEGWKDITSLLKKSGFRDIVVSIGATFGLYLLSSIIHLDPWHLFTCFIQYMFLLPSYVCVLPIYAFSNLHDLAWGTKGSTSAKDLGSAKKTKENGKEVLELSIPTAPEDVDQLWLNMKKEISTPFVAKHQKRSFDVKQADHFANVRTNTLLVYLGINMALVVFFTSDIWTSFLAARSSQRPPVNFYLVSIFWVTAGLSAFRFLGSVLYLVLRLIGL